MFHCNTHSLPKNIDLLNDLLMSLKELPSIIAISETKLKDNNIHNLHIPGYSFVGTNSQTMAGGVGRYVDENIKFIRRQDLEFTSKDFETCFIELLRNRQKNVLVGCIYRHPSGNCTTFQEFLCQKLNQIKSTS